MQTIYKILFEVRLLHEFYLTRQDGSVIFSGATPADRDQFLQQSFHLERRSINSDVSYSVPNMAFFAGHKLKLAPSYSGFKVGIEVKKTLDGAFTAFEPRVPFPAGSGITVFINRADSNVDTYTNARTKNTISKTWYVSNEATAAGKTAPFLSNPVPAFDAAYAYEQGELYNEAGKIKSFYTGITPADPAIAGMNFLNETDRLVVSSNFDYNFEMSDGVKSAVFSIKDGSGAEVYNNTVSDGAGLQRVSIRIDPLKLKKVPNGKGLDVLRHQLLVTGDGGYNKRFPLVFVDAPSGDMPWMVVNINPQPADAAFTTIDNKGLLVTRLNADGTVNVPYPVFDVCVKSRLSFWKYLNNEGSPIKNLYPALLSPSGNGLITQKPLFHSYLPVAVGSQRLPNPKPFSSMTKEGNKLCTHIIVPLSDPFPKGP